VLLAFGAGDGLDTYFEGYDATRFTPRTIVDADALRTELDRVRQQGWSLVDGELEHGLRAVAVPVARAGEVVAAINVALPATDDDAAEQASRLVPAMQEAAAAISRDLDRLPAGS